MASLLLIVVLAVVASVHAIPPSLAPYGLFPPLVEYHFAALDEFSIQPEGHELAMERKAYYRNKDVRWCKYIDVEHCSDTIVKRKCPQTCKTDAVVPTCGQVNRSTKIVGGVETELHEYPWHVGLTWSISSTRPFCGGSIINEMWILTAAHCAEIMLKNTNMVVVGEHSWSTQSETAITQKHAIKEILMHPNYNSYTQDNDIALIELAKPLIFDPNNKVAPVCPPSPTELYDGNEAIVTGWGALLQGGSSSDSLQEVVVPTIPNDWCQSLYKGYATITDSMICARLIEGGKDSCQGDSGGPMITADGSIYRQIGVVSWGYGCALPEFPGVYARITNQLEWITYSISGTSWSEPKIF